MFITPSIRALPCFGDDKLFASDPTSQDSDIERGAADAIGVYVNDDFVAHRLVKVDPLRAAPDDFTDEPVFEVRTMGAILPDKYPFLREDRTAAVAARMILDRLTLNDEIRVMNLCVGAAPGDLNIGDFLAAPRAAVGADLERHVAVVSRYAVDAFAMRLRCDLAEVGARLGVGALHIASGMAKRNDGTFHHIWPENALFLFPRQPIRVRRWVGPVEGTRPAAKRSSSSRASRPRPRSTSAASSA